MPHLGRRRRHFRRTTEAEIRRLRQLRRRFQLGEFNPSARRRGRRSRGQLERARRLGPQFRQNRAALAARRGKTRTARGPATITRKRRVTALPMA